MGSLPHRHTDVGRRFAQAATTYDAAAVLQRGIASRLMAQAHRVLPYPEMGEHWLDIGCGTGYLTQYLARRQPDAGLLLGMDIAFPMLRQARTSRGISAHWLQADAAHLPLSDCSCHRIYSNLALQWLNDLSAFLAEAYRCLSPGGWLVFATLGNDTLRELRQLREHVEGTPCPSLFLSEQQLMRRIADSPLWLRHHHRQAFCCHYADVRGLIRGLSHLGAQGVDATSRGLRGRRWLTALELASDNVRLPQGLPARYDAHFMILQRPINMESP